MTEQDLERIGPIMMQLNDPADRALIARVALRDIVATLVQRDAGRLILSALDEAGEQGLTTEVIHRRVRYVLDGPAFFAVLKEFVDRGEITADRAHPDLPCGGSPPLRFHRTPQAQRIPTAG